MSIKALKTAISVMTVMILLGTCLLFYGIWAKSSGPANKGVSTVEIRLAAGCAYRLQAVGAHSLFFASDKPDCPLSEVRKSDGMPVTIFRITQ